MNRQGLHAFSLIEVVVFIVIISLLATGIVRVFMLTSNHTFALQHSAQALNLAQARMELLLGQARQLGVNHFSDPCVKRNRPPVCIVTPGYQVLSTIRDDRQKGRKIKIITVNVSRSNDKGGEIMLTSLVTGSK